MVNGELTTVKEDDLIEAKSLTDVDARVLLAMRAIEVDTGEPVKKVTKEVNSAPVQK